MALEVSQKFKGRKRLIFFKWFFLILIILAVSFVGSIYALGRAFRLNKIEVAGNERVSAGDIQTKVTDLLAGGLFPLWPEENILFLSPENIAENIKSQFSAIDQIAIRRDFLNRILRINIKERDSWAVWCSEKCFYLDSSGVIFQPAPQFFGDLVLKITYKRAENFNLGDTVIAKETLRKLEGFISGIKNKNSFYVKTAEILPGPTFWLYADSGLKIILDNETDFERALENFQIFTNSFPEKKLQTTDYVDLRFNDKTFYKSLPVF